MNGKQDKYEEAVRIFEALSSVDEELLERSNTSRKILPFWRNTKVMAACACFAVMGIGVLTWFVSMVSVPKGSFDMARTETAFMTEGDGGYKEEAAVEDAVVEEAEMEPAEYDADMPETVMTENSVTGQEDSLTGGSAPIAPVETVLTEEELRAVEELGNYVPDVIPPEYPFESGSKAEDGSLYARWSRGMDDIVITVAWYEADEESESRIADISQPETYDVHLYEIPYAQTVPEEYGQVFDNPIFLEKDFTYETLSARMKSVADSGDTDTPRGRFSVLYESGVLVSFNGDCEPEAVWQMFESLSLY